MPRLRPILAVLTVALLVPAAASAGTQRTVTKRYGPFVVPGKSTAMKAGMEMGAMKNFFQQVGPGCRNCSITGMRAQLVDRRNRVQNWNTGVMLHHMVMFNEARQDLTCPAGPFWKERFFAAGNERTPMRLPRHYGYRIGTAKWRLLTELMNMGAQSRRLYLRVRITYTKRRLRPVRPMWLDINNCGDSEYAVPKGRSDTHRSFRSPVAGRFVAAAGHLHDGGRRIVLENASRHHTIVNSEAGYGNRRAYRGHISSMSGRLGSNLGRVRVGDQLRLHSVYDSKMAREDVMGIVVGYLAGVRRR